MKAKFLIILAMLGLASKAQAQKLADTVEALQDSVDKYFDLAAYYNTISDINHPEYAKLVDHYIARANYFSEAALPLKQGFFIAEEKKRLEKKYKIKLPL